MSWYVFASHLFYSLIGRYVNSLYLEQCCLENDEFVDGLLISVFDPGFILKKAML